VSIEGYVALPARVALRADAFGRSYWTTIGGFNVRLKLPRLDSNVVGGVVEPAIRNYGHSFLASAGSVAPVEWGFDRGSDDKGIRFAELQGVAVGIQLDGRNPRNGLQSVLDRWGPWFADLRDWVEIYSGQDLAPDYSATTVAVSAYFWTVGDRRPRLVAPLHTAITVDGRTGHLSPSAWNRLLRYVAAGLRPPAERLLLRDVGAALSRKRYRQAVLESGTLAEVALSELVVRSAGHRPPPMAQQMIKQLEKATLGRLWTVAAGVGIPLPTYFSGNGFVELRNRTAHKKAHVPTKSEAIDAAKTARELLDAAQPMHPLS
jgi:hypothetical protein